MQFVVPSAAIIHEKDPRKKIELAGRTCYKSEDRITTDSAVKFVQALIKRQHTAMLEHACFVFLIPFDVNDIGLLERQYIEFLRNDPYIHVTQNYDERRYLVSGSVRGLCQFKFDGPIIECLKKQYLDLVYGERQPAPVRSEDIFAMIVDIDTLPNLTDEEIGQHKYVTARFVTDRGVTHELVRHRPASFAQESTRYVNYLAGLSIALPTGFNERSPEVQEEYQQAFMDSERHYANLIKMGQVPQQARAVLPTALKTEIVVTACMAEWDHIFNLRLHGTTGNPHPDIKTIMEKVYPMFLDDPICKWYLTRFQ